jgi:serine/threonine-protein kinase
MDLAVEPEGCFDLVKLFDLGLAGVGDFAAETAARGTPLCRSPEQAEGKPAEYASDIYALGAIFYEMITGTPAFHGAPPSDILGKSLAGVVTMASRRAPDAGIDGPIDDMILKCLKKTPRLRFANTTELCQALDACVTDCAFLRDAHPRRPMPTTRKAPPAIPLHARRGSATARRLPSVPMTTKPSRPPGVNKPLPPPIPRTHSVARGKAQPPPIPRAWKPTPAKKRSTSEPENPAVRAVVLQKISLPDRLIPLPRSAAASPVARVTPPPIPLASDLLTEITDQV